MSGALALCGMADRIGSIEHRKLDEIFVAEGYPLANLKLLYGAGGLEQTAAARSASRQGHHHQTESVTCVTVSV